VITIWLAFLVNMAVAIGFAVIAAISAKRIGGVGPWILTAVGAIDAFLILAYRITFTISVGPHDLVLVVEGLDALLTMLSVVLVLVAFGLMMPKTIRRG